jgi:hypothetical protein
VSVNPVRCCETELGRGLDFPRDTVETPMNRLVCFLTAMAAMAVCTTSNANITNAWWHPDGDSMIVCTNWTYSGSTLSMWGTQYGNPAHMLGWMDATDPLDPTLTLGNSVNNDSGLTWLGYQVNVIMSIPFSFTTPGPTVNNPPASDWYIAGVVTPVLQVGGPYVGLYEGTLFFNAGTPVGIGDELDYLYSISFAGSTHYSFTQEAFAYETMVPEPSALVLGGLGGLMFALRLRRNRTA